MWQTALLPSLQVTLWGCQGRGCLCLLDNWANSFVILGSLNEAVAAFQPFTMTNGAELVQINENKLPQAYQVCILSSVLYADCFFCNFSHLIINYAVSYLLLEQNSSLLVLPDCQAFPDVKCSLTKTSLWLAEVRDEDRGPLSSHSFRSPT